MTETAAMADIVLPATMFMEHDDLYYGGGHQHISVGPKLIDPPGECRTQSRGAAGARPPPQGGPSRLRDDAARTDRCDAEKERPWRYRDAGGGSLARHPAGFPHLALSRRLCARRQEIPLQGRLGAIRLSATPDLGAWTRCRRCPTIGLSSRRRTSSIRSGSRPRPRAAILNTSLQRDAGLAGARRQADRDDPSATMRPRFRIADGDAVTLGNTQGRNHADRKTVRRLASRRADCGIHPSQQGPYRRPRHQHADRRRSGRAGRRRGLPRQQGLDEKGGAS